MSGSISRRVGDLPLSKGHGKHSLYHLCLAEHDEVLFRADSDYVYFLNIVATEADKQGVAVRAFACMSDHVHLAVFTCDADTFLEKIKLRYTMYFNHKYHRRGQLLNDTFISFVSGHNHEKALYSYIIRNPKHHNVAISPMSYPYASGKYYFAEALGRQEYVAPTTKKIKPLLSEREYSKNTLDVLPGGLLNPAQWLDVQNVESCYGIFRTYIFQVALRKSGADWLKEQKEDEHYFGFEKCADVTLSSIEPDHIASQEDLLSNEKTEYSRPKYTDLDVCRLIDTELVPACGKKSYAQLTVEEKSRIANILYGKYDILNRKQIARALGLAVTTCR